MLHFRTLNNKINRIHERALRMLTLIINHHLIIFWKRMALFQSVIEIFKVQLLKYINFFTVFLQLLGRNYKTQPASCIQPKNSPGTIQQKPKNCEVWYRNHIFSGSESLSNSSSKYLKLISKINIKKWKSYCPCRLFKCFLKHVGFFIKIIKATKNLLSFFPLSLNHYGPMFSGGLRISVFWGACRDQSVHFPYRIKLLVFL